MSDLLEQAKGEIIASVTNNIFKALQKQAFFDWYNEGGRFDTFITGGDLEKVFGTDNSAVVETLIKQDIQRLFGIV